MPDGDLVRHLVLGEVLILPGAITTEVRASAIDVDERADLAVVASQCGLEASEDEPVSCNAHRLPSMEPRRAHGLVRARAGDADREQHDGRVHDVAAVSPAVARDE